MAISTLSFLSLITTRGNGSPTLRQLRRGAGLRLHTIRFPYPGMKKTVQVIKKAIQSYKDAPFVRRLALAVTGGIHRNKRNGLADMRDNDAIADAIYDYMVHHVNYVHDPTGIERLQMPDTTIYTGAGDCDDMAILSGAMLESVGVPSRIRLLGETPGEFSHILIQYQTANGRWKSFDPSLSLYPGYRYNPARIKDSKVIPIDTDNSVPALFGRSKSNFMNPN
jgi:transglutaminase-like putative cysteine protease